jgi:hypothetical protein
MSGSEQCHEKITHPLDFGVKLRIDTISSPLTTASIALLYCFIHQKLGLIFRNSSMFDVLPTVLKENIFSMEKLSSFNKWLPRTSAIDPSRIMNSLAGQIRPGGHSLSNQRPQPVDHRSL